MLCGSWGSHDVRRGPTRFAPRCQFISGGCLARQAGVGGRVIFEALGVVVVWASHGRNGVLRHVAPLGQLPSLAAGRESPGSVPSSA